MVIFKPNSIMRKKKNAKRNNSNNSRSMTIIKDKVAEPINKAATKTTTRGEPSMKAAIVVTRRVMAQGMAAINMNSRIRATKRMSRHPFSPEGSHSS